MMARLVRPDARYKDSFLEAACEFKAGGHHRYVDLDVDVLARDFEHFLARELDRSPLTPQHVPDTVFWLVEGDQFIGRIVLRHHLNDFLRRFGGHIGYEVRPSRRREGHGTRMLALLLDEARAMGLAKLMLTCDADNIGSRRIIEANGGQLEGIHEWPEVNPKPYMRWWINLDQKRQS